MQPKVNHFFQNARSTPTPRFRIQLISCNSSGLQHKCQMSSSIGSTFFLTSGKTSLNRKFCCCCCWESLHKWHNEGVPTFHSFMASQISRPPFYLCHHQITTNLTIEQNILKLVKKSKSAWQWPIITLWINKASSACLYQWVSTFSSWRPSQINYNLSCQFV